MRLMPLLVFALFTSLLLMQQQYVQSMQVSSNTKQMKADAAFFLNYRSAVMAYMQKNPAFTGTIPSSSLTALYGQQFSGSFISSAGNAITVSGSGRQVTVYAALPAGALQVILQESGNDASIGLSAGTTWTSQANGVVGTAQPLAVAVPAHDVVSVFIM